MTDGREYVHDTIRSAEASLIGAPITERWIHDDSGDPNVEADLVARYGDTWNIIASGHRSGFGGAIRSAWGALRDAGKAPYIFHLEDDFLFNQPVPLDQMVAVLDSRPQLCNMALRRQAWNDAEAAAGGIVEQHPYAYTDHERDGIAWLEHRLFFTTNPGLYRRRLIFSSSWPTGANSEGRYSHALLNADPELRFGYFGARHSQPWVNHVGAERVGKGY